MREHKHNSAPITINKEFKAPAPRQRKRWLIAQSKSKAQVMQNNCTEAAYHRIIGAVKTQYMQPGEIYFERDYKTDKSDGLFSMHSFATPAFYIRLDCSLCSDYEVQYAFGKCPFKAALRELLAAYPLDRQAAERQVQPDFKTFYKTILAIQEATFIHTF